MIEIAENIFLNESKVQFSYIRSPGPGGQNVNKLATTAVLRFNIIDLASFTEDMHARLIKLAGRKMTQQGDIIIKASRHRTQDRNRQDALERLVALLRQASITPRHRKKTRPSKASIARRLAGKKLNSQNKSLRRSKPHHEEL